MITVYDILKTHSPYKPISIVGQVNKGTVNLTVFILISFTINKISYTEWSTKETETETEADLKMPG